MNRCPNQFPGIPYFASVMHRKPHSYAMIRGSDEYPNIRGQVRFFQTGHGTLVAAEIFGLPGKCSCCQDGIFAFHIHEGALCTGNCQDPFGQCPITIRAPAITPIMQGTCRHSLEMTAMHFPYFSPIGLRPAKSLEEPFSSTVNRMILPPSPPAIPVQKSPAVSLRRLSSFSDIIAYHRKDYDHRTHER